MLFPLRSGALMRSSPIQYKPTEVNIEKCIQCQLMHMIKELHNKVRENGQGKSLKITKKWVASPVESPILLSN